MTHLNPPAPASDEPMRAVRSIGTDPAFEAAAKKLYLAWTVEGVHALINAADAFAASQITPRGTADVGNAALDEAREAFREIRAVAGDEESAQKACCKVIDLAHNALIRLAAV